MNHPASSRSAASTRHARNASVAEALAFSPGGDDAKPGTRLGDDPDQAWVADAVSRYEVPLAQYCARLLGGDIERARDVVQDAFLRLWSADRASIDGHVGQWLYRVCRNRALDVRRKERRMTVLTQEHLQAATSTASAPGVRTDDSAAIADGDPTGPAVLALLESLNDTQQEALRLKFQGGLSYKEIAAVMEITANHVGVIIHHAIRTLRERLSAQQEQHQAPRAETERTHGLGEVTS